MTVAITMVMLVSFSSCKKTETVQTPFNCANYSSITTNTTLGPGTFTINCSIDVANSATLTIAPGTTLVFSQGYSLTVESGASISALGTSANPIVFKGTQAIKGYWNGIFINSISLINQFTYCTISDAGAAGGNKFGANVNLMGATASFTNCTITNSADAGFYLFGLSLGAQYVDISIFNSFTNNTVTNNGSYPIVAFAAGAGSIGAGNTFTGNANNYVAIRSENDVNVNVTLSPLSIPYLIIQLGSDPGVSFDKVFTVLPGTTIVMGSATSLWSTSTGTFIAKGTSSSPVVFKGLQATAGFWGTLAAQTSNANDFEYCTVSDGGGNASFDIHSNNRGMIGTYMYFDINRNITVKNCNLSNSGSSGIWVSAADGVPNIAPTFNSDISTSNTFSGCITNVQM